MKIWMYWEGEEVPAYYKLCQESVKRYNNNVHVIGPEDLADLIGDVPKELDKAYIVHKVDWIRKRLLYEQGGVYIDSDFICLKPLSSFQEMSNYFDYVGYKEWTTGSWQDNFMSAKKGSLILKTASEYALEKIISKSGKTEWLETNRDAIQYAFSKHQWEVDWLKIETHLINPIDVCDTNWFLSKDKIDKRFNCFGFITSVHSLGGWVSGKNRDRLLDGEEKVCQLLRKALT